MRKLVGPVVLVGLEAKGWPAPWSREDLARGECLVGVHGLP